MAQTETCPPAGAAARGVERAGRTVLVMENNPNLRGIFETLLRLAGYRVLTAAGAATAQVWIRTCAVDLVIMDFAWPDTDELTFMGQLKRDPATSALPVLVVTAYSEAEWRARSSELEAAGFLTKPFRNRDLVAEVDRILGGA